MVPAGILNAPTPVTATTPVPSAVKFTLPFVFIALTVLPVIRILPRLKPLLVTVPFSTLLT